MSIFDLFTFYVFKQFVIRLSDFLETYSRVSIHLMTSVQAFETHVEIFKKVKKHNRLKIDSLNIH